MFTKKIAFTGLFLLSTQVLFAQVNKTIISNVIYKVDYSKNGRKLVDDICVLEVTKNASYFYSKNAEESKIKMAEAFEKATLSDSKPSFSGKDFSFGKNYRAYTLKDYTKKESTIIQVVGIQLLGYIKESEINNNWKILNDTIVVSGLVCQKAEANSKGVIVTAWFCKDIPVQDGPFSYFGLPGLIAKISTSDGWEAELKGITNEKTTKKQLDIVDFVLVSEADVKKAIENAKASRASGATPAGISIQKKN